MWSTILERYLFKKCLKVRIPRTNILCISSNSKLYSKQFKVKNTFTFQNEFKQKLKDGSLHGNRIVSADLLSEPHGFVEQKEKKTLRKKDSKLKHKSKSSLTYKGEILFGIHPVYLALLEKKRVLHRLYIREDANSYEDSVSRRKEIIRLAQSIGIPVSFVDNKGLKILAPNVVHQGVCLDAGFLPLSIWNEEDHSVHQASDKAPLWLVLDELLDPMNVGAIIRSAYYFGVNKLFTVLGNSCKFSPIVSKASSGSLEVMDICQIENLEDFLKNRKNNGWCIVSTLAYAEDRSECDKTVVNVTDFSLSKPTVLILGNEGRGIPENIIKLCNSMISIKPGHELHEGIDSLNVSVAAGILLCTLKSKTVS